jgi:hypothetical protein
MAGGGAVDSSREVLEVGGDADTRAPPVSE